MVRRRLPMGARPRHPSRNWLRSAAAIILGITVAQHSSVDDSLPCAREGRNLASGRQHLVCITDPERRISGPPSSAQEKAQLHNVPMCWPCDRRSAGDSRRNLREAGKQGTPESGPEAEEVIAVEVGRAGGMCPRQPQSWSRLAGVLVRVTQVPSQVDGRNGVSRSGPAPVASQHCPSSA